MLKVLMFGWEFPPMFAGGVGMVCYELTKELASQGVMIDYLLPFFPQNISYSFLNLFDAKSKQKNISYSDLSSSDSFLDSSYFHLNVKPVRSILGAYQTQEEYFRIKKLLDSHSALKETTSLNSSFSSLNKDGSDTTTLKLYGDNLLDEVFLFAKRVEAMYKDQDKSISDFDVIHAHDWTTLPAAQLLSEKTHKPFIAHVHITEINKNAGGGVNQEVYDVEKKGFVAANKLIAVSDAIKKTLIDNYNVPAEKIEVVHNAGIDLPETALKKDSTKNNSNFSSEEQRKKIEQDSRLYHKKKGEQLVSFMGRITGMKGPENFVRVAKRVLEHRPKTKFLVAGTGDKLPATIALAKELGIYDNFYFHGFYNREEASYYFEESDVFVLPSLMEPFGVTPLEAMQKNTPVIISKQSGVSEILTHCFKVDFWDINKMASNILSILTYPKLAQTMTQEGFIESKSKTWETPVLECRRIYDSLTKKNEAVQDVGSKNILSSKKDLFNQHSIQHKTQGGQVR